MNGLEKAAVLPTLRKLVPRPLKGLLRPLWLRAGKVRYRAKYGFSPCHRAQTSSAMKPWSSL